MPDASMSIPPGSPGSPGSPGMPTEDTRELDLLRDAVNADWVPRDAYERHWAGEVVAGMWRQERLRRLEFKAFDAAEAEEVPSEPSLRRLLAFARYGARIDVDIGRALRALRVLKGRPAAHLAEAPPRTPEPERPAAQSARTPEPERPAAQSARTSEPERPAAQPARTPEPGRPVAQSARTSEPEPWRAADDGGTAPAGTAPPLNRHERRRLEALARKAKPRAA